MKKVLEYITNLWYSIFRLGNSKGGMLMKSGIDILSVAKYLICKYNSKGTAITQLKLQKLLYFIEAYYMAKYDKDNLYNDNFKAWTYGPVSEKIYSKYKKYMDLNIAEVCDDNETDLNDESIIESINSVYSIFGKLTSSQLITLTHSKKAPWSNTQRYGVISKEETKKWFKETFLES